MFKLVFPTIACFALCFPAISSAQDCGSCNVAPACDSCFDTAPVYDSCCAADPCAADPCVKTRKKLTRVSVQKEVCRLKFQCVTDECGCSRRQLVKTKKCVSRTQFKLVDVEVDPCRKGCLASLRDRLCSKSCCEPDPCAPAPCCN